MMNDINTLTPYDNGIHSLAEGLKYLAKILDGDHDKFNFKEVILRIHNGFEILLKDILFQLNPIFVLKDDFTTKKMLDLYSDFLNHKNNYLIDTQQTIIPKQIFERLEILRMLAEGITEKELAIAKKSFNALSDFRNAIQHFSIYIDTDLMNSILITLANLINTTIKVIDFFHKPVSYNVRKKRDLTRHMFPNQLSHFDNKYADIKTAITKIFPESYNIIDRLTEKYNLIYKEAIDFFKNSKLKDIQLKMNFDFSYGYGARPYKPNIKFQGFINEHYDYNPNKYKPDFDAQRSAFAQEDISSLYEFNCHILDPVKLDNENYQYGHHSYVQIQQRDDKGELVNKSLESDIYQQDFNVNIDIDILKIDNLLNFNDVPKEYLEYVERGNIILKFNFSCISHTHLFSWDKLQLRRYNIRDQIESISGNCNIKVELFLKGEKKKVTFDSEISLNLNNLVVNFDDEIMPNGRLHKEHGGLKIIFNDKFGTIFKVEEIKKS